MFGENAVLLDVQAASTAIDDYGDASTSGAEVWHGRVACHLRRERRLVTRNGLATLEEVDELIVRRSAAPWSLTPGPRATAQTLLVEDRRGAPYVTRRFRVERVELRAGGTFLDSIRVDLADGA